MQKQVLTKNFVEVLHLPGTTERIEELMKKWCGAADLTFPTDPATSEAGWVMTVAAFFDKRKSTNFCKAVQAMDGVGSIRKSCVDTSYDPMDVASFAPGRRGALSVLQKGKKRAVTFAPEFQKGTHRFGAVGKTNPRPFWFDEAAMQPAPPGEAVV